MFALTVASALASVRKNLDEVGLNESVMYPIASASGDNDSLDLVISKALPDAINDVVRRANETYLQGIDLLKASDNTPTHTATLSEDGVLTIGYTGSEEILRVVAFQAVDSNIILTNYEREGTPQARMQSNKYVRGTYDNPVLVREGFADPAVFKYYTVSPATVEKIDANADLSPSSAIKTFLFYPRRKYQASTTQYEVPVDLVDAIINKLTSEILIIFNQADKAAYYAEKVNQI